MKDKLSIAGEKIIYVALFLLIAKLLLYIPKIFDMNLGETARALRKLFIASEILNFSAFLLLMNAGGNIMTSVRLGKEEKS